MERIGDRSRFASALISTHEIASDTLEVKIQRPTGFTFLPGQFVRFIMDGYQRDYTIVKNVCNQIALNNCSAMLMFNLN